MKKSVLLLTLIAALWQMGWAQQRDRLAELNVVCRNEIVTHISVAPDGTLWMATRCGEIYRADDIHSPWQILQEGELLSKDNFENIVAFDHNTAVFVGNMWGYFKRTSTGGLTWDKIKYVTKRGYEWFHPVWRGQGGQMWTGSQDGYLAFSADSGRTFTALIDRPFFDKMNIEDIYMLSADSGWLACQKLYSTSDNWRTHHRLPTPNDEKVSRIRPWKDYLIVQQDRKSYFTSIHGDHHWQRTPLTLQDFEVDCDSGMMWALDDDGQVILMEEIDRWKAMGVRALFIIGIHDGRLYCRVNEGVIRVGRDGIIDSCPFLTADRAFKKPEQTLTLGNLQWGYDEKSVYLHDAKGWYRVARPLDIAGMTPDPDRKNRVVILKEDGMNFSIDTAGHIETYTYSQPLAAFVKPGLQSLSITTYSTLGYWNDSETISYRRNGSLLRETKRFTTKESFDPHIKGGHLIQTSPMATDKDSGTRQLPASSVEDALMSLGERYAVFPTPSDFGMNDTSLDLHQVYAGRNIYSTNEYGYHITLVNQAKDTLKAWGHTSAHVDLGGSTHYPWLLPMAVCWRESKFVTYQPILWQALREAMPDDMLHKKYLDNSTLHPSDTFQSGDLVFFDFGWSAMEQAIKASTGQYSHVALVERDSAGLWLIEATPEDGVSRRPFNDYEREFLVKAFHIYRLTIPFDTTAVIARAKSLVGKPYDDAFLPDNDAYYCSELIQVAFDGLFESKPMNWRDADGNLPEYWTKHFEKLNMSVPEGIMGTNPTDLSQSPLLRKL